MKAISPAATSTRHAMNALDGGLNDAHAEVNRPRMRPRTARWRIAKVRLDVGRDSLGHRESALDVWTGQPTDAGI